jgi:hypothetical protein
MIPPRSYDLTAVLRPEWGKVLEFKEPSSQDAKALAIASPLIFGKKTSSNQDF